MNILYVASEPRIDLSAASGHATHILKTIKGLETKGHSVYRAIAGERLREKKAKKTLRTLKTSLPIPVSVLLRDFYEIVHDHCFYKHCYKMYRQNRFHFIYERSAAYHRTGQRLSDAFSIPLILEVNSPLEELITLHGCNRALIPMASYMERMTAIKAHAIVVGSAGMRQYLVNKGVNYSKIFTIYPTADDRFFSPPRYHREIRRRLGIEDKLVVGFVGSITPSKQVDLLLQAASKIVRESTAVHFLLVGDGIGAGELKRFVANNNLEKSVTFAGRVPFDQVPEYSGAMDICIIPHATWYGSPTKLFEYAASGKPVVAPRVAPIEELIRDGENGLLVKPGNVDDLAAKILKLVADPVSRSFLGARLKSEVMRDHTWDGNSTKLIEIFNCLKRFDISANIPR